MKNPFGASGNFHAATVGNNFRAFLFAAFDQTENAIAVLRGDDRAHVGLRLGNIGWSDFDRASGFNQRRQHALGRFADRDGS